MARPVNSTVRFIAPIALIDFFSDLFLFSWSRSISILFLASPLQFMVDAQMHWWASASYKKPLFCTTLQHLNGIVIKA